MRYHYGEEWTETDKQKEMQRRSAWKEEILTEAISICPDEIYVEPRGRKRTLPIPPEFEFDINSDSDSESSNSDEEPITIPGAQPIQTNGVTTPERKIRKPFHMSSGEST